MTPHTAGWFSHKVALTASRASSQRIAAQAPPRNRWGVSLDRYRSGMAAVDRVQERRRAAALARHFRDEEGLSISEVARRLGRAEATVKTYVYDPGGERRGRSNAATRVCAAAAVSPLRRVAARVTHTSTASAAIPARARQRERAAGCETRCAPGGIAMAIRPRLLTCRARMQAGVPAKR